MKRYPAAGHNGFARPEIVEDRGLPTMRELHQKLIAAMDLSGVGKLSEEELRAEVRRAAGELCLHNTGLLSQGQREQLVNEVLDETFGLGPLEPLLRDPTITDILINGPKTVYVEREGQLDLADASFQDNRHLLQIVQRIVTRVGRRIDESSPMVDARLADGSRVNVVIPPLALDGPLVSIRRFGVRALTVDGLLASGALTSEMLDFLSACVQGRLNLMISGGTGSGKTTLLNALSAFIPPNQRIATIEDAAELGLQQRHVVRLETRPPNSEGSGEVTTRDLVRNALRMRPDRIIIGECRGAEALDMLQAMNTGHAGSMTTLHADDTRDALGRLEMLVSLGALELPLWIIRRQIAAAIHIVVQVSRLAGGARKVVRISEVAGLDGDTLNVRDLFEFRQTGVDQNQTAQGHFYATGNLPACLKRLAVAGAALPAQLFDERVLAARSGA